jgi:hypothetical protein
MRTIGTVPPPIDRVIHFVDSAHDRMIPLELDRIMSITARKIRRGRVAVPSPPRRKHQQVLSGDVRGMYGQSRTATDGQGVDDRAGGGVDDRRGARMGAGVGPSVVRHVYPSVIRGDGDPGGVVADRNRVHDLPKRGILSGG